MIRLQCICGRKMSAPEQWLGKRVKCPQCGKPVSVSRSEEPAAEAVAEQAEVAAAHTGSVARPAANAPANVSAGDRPISERPQPAQAPETADPEVQASAPRQESNATRSPLRPPVSTSIDTWEKAPEEIEKDDFHLKRGRLPRFLGVLGILMAIGAAASCWSPDLDSWTQYIALGGIGLSTLGFGLSLSRYRVGLWFPVIGLVLSGLAMSFPYVVPRLGKFAPAGYLQRADDARRKSDEAAIEAQRRGLLSVESIRLTDNNQSVAPELAYKLINQSGKTIKTIKGSIQIADRDHRPLGGLGLDLTGPFAPNVVIQGTNVWTMDQTMHEAIADKKIFAEYRAQEVTYGDGKTKSYGGT